jgi:predicted ribosomally synthesized peptide with SipW-like signal peptide
VKRTLGLFIAAMLVLLSLGGGTWALFADNEASANNALVSGTLDLQIDGGDGVVNTFSASCVSPGDSGDGYVKLANIGSLSGELDVTISTVSNTGGHGNGEYEDGIGHLGGKAKMALFLDINRNEVYDAGDIGLKYDGTTYAYPTKLQYKTINKYDATHWDALAMMPPSAAYGLQIHWEVPGNTGNEIQGDSVSFGIMFTLEQPESD